MNFSHKLIKIAFILFYALSIGLVPSSTNGEATVLPEIDGNGPQINGNLTEEWQNSIRFDTQFNGEEANIFVQVNGSHVFIGFNYTSNSPFIPVNDTLPIDTNLNYNNATHDWLALQFDNNLDQESIGSEDSPDDLISVDQYRGETFDGFIQGNSTHPIVRDDNSTIGGTEDSTGFRTNYTEIEFINDIDTIEVFKSEYEFSKPLSSGDVNGADLNLVRTNILQFKILYWTNQTANATIPQSQTTEWFTARLNDTGTGLNTKLLNDTKIDVLIDTNNINQFNAFRTVIEQYDFDLSVLTSVNISDAADLSLIILGSTGILNLDDIQGALDIVKTGGSLLIFLNPENSLSNSVANLLGMNYLSNNLIIPGEGVNESETIFTASANTKLPFVVDPSPVTNTTVTEMAYSSSGFNVSDFTSEEKPKYLLSQEYYFYDLFNLPSDLVYDEDNDLVVGVNETKNGISAGVAFDFIKGGRLALFPTSDMIINNNVTSGDFMKYILRMLPWSAKTINTLDVDAIKINTHNVKPGDSLSLTVNVTDEFGNQFEPSIILNVTSKLILGGHVIDHVDLQGSGSGYSDSITIQRTGFMTIETVIFLEGYGFAEGEVQNIVSESSVRNFNDIEFLSYLLTIIFLAGVVLVIFILVKTKPTE